MSTEVRPAESVLDLVDQLEDMVAGGRRLPLSTSVLIDEEELLDVVDRIRLGLPDELVRARQGLDDAQRMVATAEEEAERTLSRAEQEAERRLQDAREQSSLLVSQHHIVSQAEAHADALLAEAEERAAAVRRDADAYAREVMSHLEDQLARTLSTVRRGLETLPTASAAARAGRRRRS